ncbi:MAG: two-component system sensor histidine kinase NtrB [bacterium]
MSKTIARVDAIEPHADDRALPRGPVQLADAFASFEGASLALSTAYGRLEDQFRKVNCELEKTNRDLATSLLETESMRRLLDRILASVPCGILSCGRDGRITTANAAMTQMLGLPAGALVDGTYEEFVGGWDEIALLFAMKSSGFTGPVARGKTLLRKDGTTLQVESTVCALLSSEGAPVGVVEVMKDMTDVRRLQDAIREAQTLAALGEMAAGLAHEIRNPLGGIKGFASLLARDLAGDPGRTRILDSMTRAIDSLNRIVTDFLAFGEPGRPVPRLLDARSVAVEALALLEAEGIFAEGVAIERDFPHPLRHGFADRDQLKQALINILRNAAEATPAGGSIRVAVECSAAMVRVIVSDTGAGIPEETMKRLYRPFASTKPGGSGLGLAVARSLLEKNGGTLGLSSTPRGTTATISFPAAPEDVDLRGGAA